MDAPDILTEEQKKAWAERAAKRPYFIWWDQDVTEEDIRDYLANGTLYERVVYMSYILNDAEFEDVWKYLKLKEIQKYFWQIRWRTTGLRDHWRQLLTLLGYPPDECADPRAARVLG
ncbi:MAG: hypothetical protein HY784_10595 [Chloroflexi bacterium]|nr:hypothetical protein [Chloroflexota bacterium]